MATSEAGEASRPELTSERRRRRVVRADGHPYDEEELQRFFTLGPTDVAFFAGTRSDRNRSRGLEWAAAQGLSLRLRPPGRDGSGLMREHLPLPTLGVCGPLMPLQSRMGLQEHGAEGQ